MNRNINWPSCHNINQPTRREPRFLTSQIWMNELENDMRAQGVEIIEINSTDSQSSNEDNKSPNIHPWSYASCFNTETTQQEPQDINGSTENGSHNEFDHGSLYFNSCKTPDTAELEAFNQTCLNILDKLSALTFESSPEDIDSNEARDGDLEAKWNPDQEELIYGSDLDGDKRTIWIYSFKNRQILSEETYEVVNIPSHETISSNSSEIDKELNSSKSTRASSPIPISHIPRLDLSLGATLPNVTEVTEPESQENVNQKRAPFRQTANNWCVDNSKAGGDKDTYIHNWTALPQRERPTRHINASILQTVTEVPKESPGEAPGRAVFQVPQYEDKVQKELNENVTDPAIFEVKSTRNEDIADETTCHDSQINSQRSTKSKRKFVDNATYLISPFVPRLSLNPFTDDESVMIENTSAIGQVALGVTVVQPSSPTNVIENLDNHVSFADEWKGRLDRKVKSAGDKPMTNMSYLNPVEWKTFPAVSGSSWFMQAPKIEARHTLLQRCVSCLKCCK